MRVRPTWLWSAGLCLLGLLSGCGGSNTSSNSSSRTSLSSSLERSSQPFSSISSSSSRLSSSSQSSVSSLNSSSSQGYQEGDYILGMDISYWSEQLSKNAIYIDTDGVKKDLLALLKNHGINYIRLRTFVDPWAKYGYAANTSGCTGKTEPFNSKEDIINLAKRIKAAGMGFLLDFHYSDTWADPGKQIIPEAWRNSKTTDEMAAQVRLYTLDVLNTLKANQALPNMVQVGNEITPGLLIHVPAANTDCWGNNATVNSSVTGRASSANWSNLAKLLTAGINATKQVDPNIKTLLHIENTDEPVGVEAWVDSALRQNVKFDVLGFSAYASFQGPASAWSTHFKRYAQKYPSLKLVVAEYNPEATLLNSLIKNLPNQQGLGTFLWEPTEGGSWGNALFSRSGNTYTALKDRFQEYDKIR